MGAAGPRHLVSLRGSESTVGIKYETNIIILFCQVLHPAPFFCPKARQGKEGLIVQVDASEWFNCSFLCVFFECGSV